MTTPTTRPLSKPAVWIDEWGVAWWGCRDGRDVPADRRPPGRARRALFGAVAGACDAVADSLSNGPDPAAAHVDADPSDPEYLSRPYTDPLHVLHHHVDH